MNDNCQGNTAISFIICMNCNINCKKYATCNANFEKPSLSDMHYPARTFRPIMRSIGLLDNELPRKEIISTDDRRTDGRTDRRTDVANDNNR